MSDITTIMIKNMKKNALTDHLKKLHHKRSQRVKDYLLLPIQRFEKIKQSKMANKRPSDCRENKTGLKRRGNTSDFPDNVNSCFIQGKLGTYTR